MALVIKNDLINVNGSKIITSLDTIGEDAKKLANRIQSFINNSKTNLTGIGYDAVRSKMSLYIDALEKQGQIYNNLKNNLLAANNTMINYMEEFDKLDDSQVEIADNSLKQAKQSLLNLNNLKSEYMTLQSDETKKESSKNYSIADLNAAISAYTEEIIRLEKLVAKLRNLGTADDGAYGMVSAVINDISNYKIAIGEINVSTLPQDSSKFDAIQKSLANTNNYNTNASSTLYSGQSNSFYNLGNRDVLYYDQHGYKDENGRFVEWDSKWRSLAGNTIKDAGCGPTSYATILGTIKHDSTITPATIADVMAENNISNNSNFVKRVSDIYGLNCEHSKFNSDTIEQVIKQGGGFIAAVNNGSHYISVTDVVYKDGIRYFVLCDSWPEFNNNIAEPILITESQLKGRNISMNFYITPGNVPLSLDEKGNYLNAQSV